MSIRRIKNPQVMHPLEETDLLKIDMEWDEESRSWVSYVPELNGISTYGPTYEKTLDRTAEMIVGWIQTMDESGLRLPISRRRAENILQLLER